MQFARTPFVLDDKALALGRASDVLAVDPSVLGSTMALRTEEPGSLSYGSTSPGVAVAVVEVFGPLAQRGDRLCGFVDGYDTIGERLDEALEAADAVVVVIDSPGGDAAGMSAGVRKMRAAVEASGKPVYVYVDELAASAAYALATVGNKIYLGPTCRVGSIGCAAIHVEQSRALQNAGITPTVIRSSPNKMAPNALEPLSDEGRTRMQARVDEMALDFASLVAERRGGTPAGWLAKDAATWTGADAVEVGLADGVASLDEVISMAADAAQGSKSMTIKKADSVGATLEVQSIDVDALEVGRVALALTGAADSEGAIKALRLWQGAAAKAEALEADRAKAEADAEAKERIELVRGMVARNALAPHKAWISDEKGPRAELGAVEPWASMKMKHLRAAAGAFEAPPARKASAADESASVITKDVQAKAKAIGVKPESLAEAAREIAAITNGATSATLGG